MDTAFILVHRLGGPPETSKEGAHQQLAECATPEMWSELVLACFEIEGVSPGGEHRIDARFKGSLT